VTSRDPLVAVVGPCGSGKSTLVAALGACGVRAREVAQEHSYVPSLWKRVTAPDVLVYLVVSREVAQQRMGRSLPCGWWEQTMERLAHARSHADLVLDTDALDPGMVLQQVLAFLQR